MYTLHIHLFLSTQLVCMCLTLQGNFNEMIELISYEQIAAWQLS